MTIATSNSVREVAGQLPGTAREITRQFRGKVGDLKGDGKVADINSRCRGFSRGPTDDGKYFAGFDLTPYDATSEFQLYFIFPVLSAGQVVVTNTASGVIDVWLFRKGQNGILVARHKEEQLIKQGGQKMHGRVAIKWNSDADFVIGADVTHGTNSIAWARGQFVGSAKTRLNPMLWEWPAILIFGESK